MHYGILGVNYDWRGVEFKPEPMRNGPNRTVITRHEHVTFGATPLSTTRKQSIRTSRCGTVFEPWNAGDAVFPG